MRVGAAALAAWLLMASGAQALNLAIFEDDSVPKPGHVRNMLLVSYTPYYLVVKNGTTYSQNPPGLGNNATVVADQFEIGLMPDAALGIVVPYGANRMVDPELDPVLGSTSGIGDVGVSLSRKVWSTDRIGVCMRLGATYPSGNADLLLGAGVPQISLNGLLRYDFDSTLRGVLFGDYTYGMRRLIDSAAGLATQWSGHQAVLSTGARYTPWEGLTLSGLALIDYFSPGEANRQAVPASGFFTLALSPGARLSFGPGIAWHLVGAFPVVRTGFQDSNLYSAMTGVELEF